MKAARIQFALRYRHWTLDGWKVVIWSGETGHGRGGYGPWNLATEKMNKKAIRPRFARAIKFMFWGAFSYDRKALEARDFVKEEGFGR